MSPDILKSISTSGLLPARVLFHRVSCPYGSLLRAGCQMFWTLFSCFYDCLLIFIIFFLIDTVIDFITSSSTQLSDPLLKIMGMPVMNQDRICLLHAWRNNKAMNIVALDQFPQETLLDWKSGWRPCVRATVRGASAASHDHH